LATKVYDVIVVGTGAGGGTAMKILCEAGLQVCALNSGPRTDPEKDYRGHRQVYDLKYRGYGNPLRLKGKAHQSHTRSKSRNTAKVEISSNTMSLIPTRPAPTGTGSDAKPRGAKRIFGADPPHASAISISRPPI